MTTSTKSKTIAGAPRSSEVHRLFRQAERSTQRRRVFGLIVLVVLALGCAVIDLLAGGGVLLYPDDVVAALNTRVGRDSFLVWDVRLPRLATFLSAGAALGLAGAITRSVTRSPIVTPDLLGIPQGAVLGSLLASQAALNLSSFSSIAVLFGAALAGGSAVAVSIALVAASVGNTNPLLDEPARVVMIGVAIGLSLSVISTALLTSMGMTDPATILRFSMGGSSSAAGARWEDCLPPLAALTVSILFLPSLAVALGQFQFGDAIAHQSGLSPARVRGSSSILAIILVCGAVSTAGPLAFVALAAPMLARRVVGHDGPALAASAVSGALVVVFADIVAQAVMPWNVPVGALTAAAGGPLLVLTILKLVHRETI